MLANTSDSRRRATRMSTRKRVALIAHDHCKGELLEWARFNQGTLIGHELDATGTTGALLTAELGLPVARFASGPLGGDQQVGAAIVEGRIDFVIFFWDPLEPQPHDVDVKACCGWPSSTTSRSRATGRPPTSCSRLHSCTTSTSGSWHARRYRNSRLTGSPPTETVPPAILSRSPKLPGQQSRLPAASELGDQVFSSQSRASATMTSTAFSMS